MNCIYYNNKNKDTCSDEMKWYNFEGIDLPVCIKHEHKFWKIKWELEEARVTAYKKLLAQK